jgi:flagellar biosynthetic protein FlhB
MSAGEEPASDKEHEPSQKRLDDARRKGDLAKSLELSGAGAYAGLLLAMLAGGAAFTQAGTAAMILIDQAPELAELAAGSARSVAGGLVGAILLPLGLLFLLPMLASLATLIAQQAVVVAPSRLEPKLQRISPLATAKHKFGPEGLMEFAKSFGKLVLVSVILTVFLSGRAEDILTAAALPPEEGLRLLGNLVVVFMLYIIVLTAAIGALDYLWQRHALMQRNRMSRKEMMDEMKESEGDPYAKRARRERGQELALNQMLADVAEASVVIVNPTHYAVALKWRRGSPTPPIVVAKGVDDVAARIREKAAEAGVPIHRDPPTARALHATVEIGRPIDQGHYRAVAAAIRFAEAMRRKARSLGR